jgi:membrane protein
MKALQTVRQRVVRMLTSPGEELGSWARFVRFQVRLWYFCVRRLRENNALAMSSALSFRTIFALVPAIVLGIVVLKSFGALEDSKQALREVLARSGLSEIVVVGHTPSTQPATRPESTTNVAEEIEKIVTRVEKKLTFGRLGPIGVVLLIWSALTLLTTMERSLNRIFAARRSRGPGRRVMLYWSAMTLGPVALFVAGYASNKAAALFEGAGRLGWMLAAVGWAQPILVGIVLLTALYVLMPNTKVPVRSALGGAVVALPLWLLAKWGFGVYVRELVGTDNLYGSLGLLPLFLLWLNLSWYLFLFGGQIAHTAANLGEMTFARRGEPPGAGPWELLAAALAVAGRHASEAGAATAAHVAERLGLPEASARAILDRLAAAGAVCRVERPRGGAYVPARAPERTRISEVVEFLPPAGEPRPPETFDADLARRVRRIRRAAGEALADITLADLLAADEGGGEARKPPNPA